MIIMKGDNENDYEMKQTEHHAKPSSGVHTAHTASIFTGAFISAWWKLNFLSTLYITAASW